MESVMTDIMYTVPSDTGIARVVITEDSVQEGGQPVVLRTKDLAG
jgi:ATP-dependent protease Clp ATPase subunit